MTKDTEDQALVQAELRDLKRTVIALRHELEAAHSRAAEKLRATEVSYNAESAQLKNTVTALREELEQSLTEREQAVQQAMVTNHNDSNQHNAAKDLPASQEKKKPNHHQLRLLLKNQYPDANKPTN